MTGSALSTLYKSAINSNFRTPFSLNFFETRRSSWFQRSPYCVPGEISATVAVARAPADKLRPSDGAIKALGTLYDAVIAGPGLLWNEALVAMFHQGRL